jgi:transcription initiation factor TFIID subunit TAF12
MLMILRTEDESKRELNKKQKQQEEYYEEECTERLTPVADDRIELVLNFK